MLKEKIGIFSVLIAALLMSACAGDQKESKDKPKVQVAKGLYSFGPELKLFTVCESGKEYWVADSAKTLELAYQNLAFEKPYLPVYIEVEYHFIKSDTLASSANYDSTMVVTKLLKISKQIPTGPCAQ
ncbi:hypothetical protein [Pedobacter insulae]|uniref:NlpE C-terminal OB domain-containing protein n=1 Tax=Pedobacter insulae TaxID=414048 RepID=A0A1I2SXR6_9SPHI|nr:hypothetical protein [Pedobacter insulae]SFG57398.1 hypothetical protein SAMN04489864_101104 [Pedobacter insulae]